MPRPLTMLASLLCIFVSISCRASPGPSQEPTDGQLEVPAGASTDQDEQPKATDDGEATLASRVNTMDPTVTWVRSFGWWDKGTRPGMIRLVAFNECGREHCYESQFVQWIEEGNVDNPTKRIIQQARIGLPLDAMLLQVSGPEVPTDVNRLELLVEQASVADDLKMTKVTYCVGLREPGKVDVARGACAPE